jgi:ribosomal protein S14
VKIVRLSRQSATDTIDRVTSVGHHQIARMAICAVSGSRISPIVMMFGLCRRKLRSAVANVRPIGSATYTWVIPWRARWRSVQSALALSRFRPLRIKPPPSTNSRSTRRGAAMTDSRWELPIVLVLASTFFWSAWHLVEQLLS